MLVNEATHDAGVGLAAGLKEWPRSSEPPGDSGTGCSIHGWRWTGCRSVSRWLKVHFL